MAFDAKKFRQSSWEPRTEDVHVPMLADFFPEGEKPVFKVRGLDGRELAKMRAEGTEGRKKLVEAAAKIASGDHAAVAEALGDMEGDSTKTYMDIFMVETGCIEPKLTRADVILLHRHRHTAFIVLGNAITRLSGEGSRLGESKRSGGTRKSAPT